MMKACLLEILRAMSVCNKRSHNFNFDTPAAIVHQYLECASDCDWPNSFGATRVCPIDIANFCNAFVFAVI
jgi:hypothetical protein